MLFGVLKGKYEQMYEQSEEFQQELKLKVREILTQQEWRRRKMQMRVCWKLCYFLVSIGCFHFWLHILMIFLPFSSFQISEEEGRLKKDEEETKEMWKRKREHEEQWEGTREQRVCFHLSSNVSWNHLQSGTQP